MKVPLLDLKKQYEQIKDEVLKVTESVYDSQYFILGPEVESFEKEVAQYSDCKYAVGVSSGTDALVLSLMAADIKKGDLVITSPYTFFATVGSITRTGAEPLFVDIDERSYNIDPERLKEKIESLDKETRSRLKAIIPVHLYGQCARMSAILEIAKEFDLVVIEDAAQAIGSEYELTDGTVKRAGSMGDYGCFSFFPSKNLGGFGDGGMVTTNDEEIYERLKIMRVHGSKPKYYHQMIGGNFRLDALQAVILSVKLKYLDGWTEKRIANADLYRELFAGSGISNVALPQKVEKRHIYNQFIIKVQEKRDELRDYLQSKDIGCEIYYPVPLHIQECFSFLGHKNGDFPVSEAAALSTLALPVYPELTKEQMQYVVDVTAEFLKGK